MLELLGFFHVLAVINSAAMNTGVCAGTLTTTEAAGTQLTDLSEGSELH